MLTLPAGQVASGHVLHSHPADHAAHFSRDRSRGEDLNDIRTVELGQHQAFLAKTGHQVVVG